MNPRTHLEKAISLRPEYPEAFYRLGLLNKSEGKAEDALENFKQAVSINKDFAEAQCELAISLTIKESLRKQETIF